MANSSCGMVLGRDIDVGIGAEFAPHPAHKHRLCRKCQRHYQTAQQQAPKPRRLHQVSGFQLALHFLDCIVCSPSLRRLRLLREE